MARATFTLRDLPSSAWLVGHCDQRFERWLISCQIEAQLFQAIVDRHFSELPQEVHPDQQCRALTQSPNTEYQKIGNRQGAVVECQSRKSDLIDHRHLSQDLTAGDVDQPDGSYLAKTRIAPRQGSKQRCVGG